MLAVMHNKQIDDKIKAKIYEVCFLEMARLHFGQGADIVWHRGLVDADKITEEKYLQMCACKTGALVRLTAKLAAILAGARQDVMDKIGNFAESIGVAFQIRDDILNLGTGKFVERKGYGDDITEGKMTLLVIHTLKKANAKDRKRLVEILRAKTRDKVLIEEGIGIIKKYDSFEYAERVASKLVAKAWEDVEKVLPDSSAKEKLRMLAQYLIKRDI
jgi:geranylgeranyl pyrophosphate synthase